MQRNGSVYHDLQHHKDEDRVERAQPRSQLADGPSRQPLTTQVGEHRARTQAEQRNRNRQKGEMVKQHHRK